MLTFKNFLTEEQKLDFDSVPLKEIKQNCSDWISNVKVPLYRGTKSKQAFVKYPVKSDRTPRDTSEVVSSILNLGIETVTGEERVRERSVFATIDRRAALTYGNLFFVFAPNGYSMIYANNIFDATDQFAGSSRQVHSWIARMSTFKFLFGANAYDVIEWFDKNSDKAEPFPKTKKEYYAWAKKTKFPFTKQFLENLQAFFNIYSYVKTKKTFHKVSNYTPEIMVFDVPYVYLINVDSAFEKYNPDADFMSSSRLDEMYSKLLKDISES